MNYSSKEDKLESETGVLFFLQGLPIRIKKELLLHQATVSLGLTQVPELGLEMD